MNRPLKVTIIGAGSVYTPELLDQMGKMRDVLTISELRLMDINPDRLQKMEGFVKRFLANIDYPCEVSSTMDRIAAIKGVDFVITQIRVGGNQARTQDEHIPLKYGFLGQETTGAGGFAKALRTIPVMVDIARDVETYNPDAWIINYTNPTGIVAEAVTKYTNAHMVSLCGGGRHPGNMLYRAFGIAHERVRYDYFGLNHFNFSYNITIDGRPVTDEEFAAMAERCGFDVELIKKYRLLPSLYLPYFWNKKDRFEHVRDAEQTRGEIVQGIERELYAQYADPAVCTKPALLARRGGGDYAEMALGVMCALGNNIDTFAVCNVPNNGAVPFLPDDAVIETACMVNAAGCRPLTFGSFPDTVWGIVSAVKNYESLTVEAAMHGDRDYALFALLAHPLVLDYDRAAPMLEELLQANRDMLPNFFPKEEC